MLRGFTGMASRTIGGYPRGQLETMIRLQRRALIAERSELTHTITEATRRRDEVDYQLQELERADHLLHDD
ncbi:hypothetical protein SEA_TYPHA_36 [Mycobacterium phage Typha]|uniref:Uncharacterized protein n=1 Tax=Mycobacterium phage Typha TaxID=2517971 RepID=A0A482J804_9CAUD|nr:hypothetical protein KCH40_gp036 [Mycobacterium phage Typha]QBP29693.1 hypothetical protein SEA_TYPHA_36 [Mycobacterium phage Typha]URM86480.1 hypothetical protein PBI_HILLTOPFARM_36 [Mycobacterium phage Hilltopfarm]